MDVKVFAPDGLQIKQCRLRDISLNGAFIETQAFALTQGSGVAVVLKMHHGGKATHYRLPAKVVRVERDGAALTFDDLDKPVYTILGDVLKLLQQKPDRRSKT